MATTAITDKEFDKLIERLIFFDTMRNNLLTFSFTAVLAALGVAVGTEVESLNAWVCLIPFFLIIPFAARISYYRISYAHTVSFLKVFAPEKMIFEGGSSEVHEGQCRFYGLIAWLVNHEMLLLGLATSCIFYFRYVPQVETWGRVEYLSLVVPVLCMLPICLISMSTYKFKDLSDPFITNWKSYKIKQNSQK